MTRIKEIKENKKSTKHNTIPKLTGQINTHDTTSKPIKRVETDIIRQGVPDVDNTFTEKFERTQAVVWCLKSLYLCPRVLCKGLNSKNSFTLTCARPKTTVTP